MFLGLYDASSKGSCERSQRTNSNKSLMHQKDNKQTSSQQVLYKSASK